MASDRDGIDGQRRHWRSTFEGNPTMYGTQPSAPGRYAVELFRAEGVRDVVELGAGQGRDTLAFLQAGMSVTAFDYADEGLAELRESAAAAGAGGQADHDRQRRGRRLQPHAVQHGPEHPPVGAALRPRFTACCAPEDCTCTPSATSAMLATEPVPSTETP